LKKKKKKPYKTTIFLSLSEANKQQKQLNLQLKNKKNVVYPSYIPKQTQKNGNRVKRKRERRLTHKRRNVTIQNLRFLKLFEEKRCNPQRIFT